MAYIPTPTEQATGNLVLKLCRYMQMRTAGQMSTSEIVSGVLRFMSEGGAEKVLELIGQEKRGKRSSLMKRHR